MRTLVATHPQQLFESGSSPLTLLSQCHLSRGPRENGISGFNVTCCRPGEIQQR